MSEHDIRGASNEAAHSSGAGRPLACVNCSSRLEYGARSVFCVLSRGFSSKKRDCSQSILIHERSLEKYKIYSNVMALITVTQGQKQTNRRTNGRANEQTNRRTNGRANQQTTSTPNITSASIQFVEGAHRVSCFCASGHSLSFTIL